MATTIGPNFGNELAAAGLVGLPISWSAAGSITYGPSVTAAQQSAAEAVLAAHNASKPDLTLSVQVNSTGTPALDGVYAIDPKSQRNITAEALYIQTTTAQGSAKFTNGQTTKAWYDTSGAAHTFTTAQFISFAEAIAAYVDGILAAQLAMAAGQTPTWPTSPLTIP